MFSISVMSIVFDERVDDVVDEPLRSELQMIAVHRQLHNSARLVQRLQAECVLFSN